MPEAKSFKKTLIKNSLYNSNAIEMMGLALTNSCLGLLVGGAAVIPFAALNSWLHFFTSVLNGIENPPR